jgi:hypothetical protein
MRRIARRVIGYGGRHALDAAMAPDEKLQVKPGFVGAGRIERPSSRL